MGKGRNLFFGRGRYSGGNHSRVVLKHTVLPPMRLATPDTSVEVSLTEKLRIAVDLLGVPSAREIVSTMLCNSKTAGK